MGDLLKGRVAIVTGSGQGIGRAIAIYMAIEGAKIVTNNRKKGSTGNAILSDELVNSLDDDKKEWLKKEAEASTGDAETTTQTIRALGGEAVPFFGDISNFDTARALVQTAIDNFGKLDILVNVAGNFGFSPVWEITEETWDRVNDTKPKGYFNAIRHAVPHMIENKWGRIINCTSRAFLGDVLKHAEYCAANAGVVGLTRGVAKELFSYGITCNAFSPFAKTRADHELKAYEMAVSSEKSPWMDKKFSAAMPAETPSPEHIAPFITYLASEYAAGISGSVFSVGGNGIGLYSEPEIKKQLVKFGDPWSMEELIQQAPRALFADYKSTADLG
ncbi:MAG: SDR family oxidoreductase [Eubacteriaceae bacterium]|nr:SDR family oxidoreductase [Eubacteriaceae bacterium]